MSAPVEPESRRREEDWLILQPGRFRAADKDWRLRQEYFTPKTPNKTPSRSLP